MESLVHYQTLLARRHFAVLGDEECERLRASSLDLLQRLEVMDPLRKQRYRDLGESSVHHRSHHGLAKKLVLFTCFLGAQHRPLHQINDVGCIFFVRSQGWYLITQMVDKNRELVAFSIAWLAAGGNGGVVRGVPG